MVKIAVVIYSTYGHILTVSKAEAEGAKAAGAEVDVFQLPSGEQNDASASADLPVITPSKLAEYDGVLFGIPSRYGTHPYAFKAFLDATGAQWASGAYHGKYAGFFVTTGTQGGGQETVIRNSITILAHHGFLYVPLGYARAFGELTNLTEIHGGSPWGAGSIAGADGSRQPSKLELDTARIQGKSFAEIVGKAYGKTTSIGSGDAAGATGNATGTESRTTDAADATGATGASGTAGTAGTAGAAGAAGAGSTSKDASDAAGKESSTTTGAAAGAQSGDKDKTAPEKGEKAAANAEDEAKGEAKKEKSSCCGCM